MEPGAVQSFSDATFDMVVTSPTYGNRMADHHNAKDGRRRITYTHNLGRTLTPGNSGAMQWGEDTASSTGCPRQVISPRARSSRWK